MIFLRTGYLINYDERGLTVGAGFNKQINKMTVGINYAYTPFGYSGVTVNLPLCSSRSPKPGVYV